MNQNIYTVLCIALFTLFTISLIVHLWFLGYIVKAKRKYKMSVGKVIGFLLYILGQMIMCVVFVYASLKFPKYSLAISSLVAMLFTFIPIYELKNILDDIVEMASVDERYKYILRKSEIEQKYYMLMKDYEDKLSKLRHEFMNQVQVAYSIIENSDNREVGIEMLDELNKKIESTRIKAFCGNQMVNIIISMKHDELREYDINLKTDVILPENIYMDEMDLCSIIMNGLDEIIEIRKIKNSKEETLLDIHRKNDMICIIIKLGHIEDDEEGSIEKVMGYYEKILEQIAKKYNGSLYRRDEEGVISNIITVNVSKL